MLADRIKSLIPTSVYGNSTPWFDHNAMRTFPQKMFILKIEEHWGMKNNQKELLRNGAMSHYFNNDCGSLS